MILSDVWARGTLESLKRKGNGQVITAEQVFAELRQERDRLRDQLADARKQIAVLEHRLSIYEATGGHDRLVNMTEAAQMLKVHASTISRWVAAGHFKLYHDSGAKPLIYASSLIRPEPKKRGRKKP